jgi:hypothetical protein
MAFRDEELQERLNNDKEFLKSFAQDPKKYVEEYGGALNDAEAETIKAKMGAAKPDDGAIGMRTVLPVPIIISKQR